MSAMTRCDGCLRSMTEPVGWLHVERDSQARTNGDPFGEGRDFCSVACAEDFMRCLRESGRDA